MSSSSVEDVISDDEGSSYNAQSRKRKQPAKKNSKKVSSDVESEFEE